MKKIVCELCGSTNLMKKDGVWICESCGAKFTLEEAKKMLVDGIVDVKGKVSIDDTERLDNYFVQAETMLEAKDVNKALEYCDKILENDINYEKAWFLKGKISFGLNYDNAILFFKKAVSYAKKKNNEAENSIISAIDNFIEEHCEYVCNKYNPLGIVTQLRSKIFSDRKQYTTKPQVINEKIQKVFEDYLKNSFDLINYFKPCDDYEGSGIEHRKELLYLLEILNDLEISGYLTQRAKTHIVTAYICLLTENLKIVEQNFINYKRNNNNSIPIYIVQNYTSVILISFMLFDQVLKYNVADRNVIISTFNKIENHTNFYKKISWTETGHSFEISDSVKKNIDEQLEKMRTKVCIPQQTNKTYDKCEIMKDNSYTCEKCDKAFKYHPNKEYCDDEKENVVCHNCGNIQSKKNSSDNFSEIKQDGNSEQIIDDTAGEKQIPLQIIIWSVFLVSAFICCIVDGGLEFKNNNVAQNISIEFGNNSSKVEDKNNTTHLSENEVKKDKDISVSFLTRLEANVEKKTYTETEDNAIKLTVSLYHKDKDCTFIKPYIDNVLKSSGFAVTQGDCQIIKYSDKVEYVIKMSTAQYGRVIIPSFSIGNLKSEQIEIFIENENELIDGIRNLDFYKISNYLPSWKKIENYNIDGKNAIFYLFKKYPGETEAILDYLSDVNITDGSNGTSLLISSIVNNNTKLFNYLLLKNVDIDYVDKKGRTAIMYAAIKNNIYMIKKLIEKGADLLKTRDDNWTAYQYAKEYGNREAAELLYSKNDEIIFYYHECEKCNSKKAKFEEFIKDHPTLKVKYLDVSEMPDEIRENIQYLPVVWVLNSKNQEGQYINGWDGSTSSLKVLFSKRK